MLRVGHVTLQVGAERRTLGDPIPEAAGFKNFHAYLRTGQVVDDEDFAPDLLAAARLGDALRFDPTRTSTAGAGGPSSPASAPFKEKHRR